MYTYEEVLSTSKDYFNGDELAAKVFVDKYAMRDNNNQLVEKSPEQTHRRLAKEFARIEAKYINPLSEEEIYNLFDKFKYVIPQGSPMSAIGNDYQIQSTSNCFVLPSPQDSYGGILFTDQQQAQLMKRRGGVGFDISNIRPKGISTKNAAKTTDGIAVFMERFSNTTREVAQNGRRGALMLTISVHHPEIDTFINIKKDKKKVTGANISVRISDEFMNAVKNNNDVELRWPVDSKNPTIVKKVNAKKIWNNIIEAAWESAEPGLLFWDTIINRGPANAYEQYRSVSTNPCSELDLSKGDSCRLIVCNLCSFVKNPYKEDAYFNFDNYKRIVIKAQRLMDDMIDLEIEKIDNILNKVRSDPEDDDIKKIEIDLWEMIKTACVNGRRTGLGITGLGDTLASLNIRYGSEESIKITEEIYKTLSINSEKSSCILAKERGVFPAFDREKEKNHPFISQLLEVDEELKELYNTYGRRSISTTTTAPVGSISMLTQTTSGIEPAFLLKYNRRKKIMSDDKSIKADFIDAMGDRWQEFTVYHHGFKKWMDLTGKSSIEESPYYKATSNDVDWLSSVKIQSVAQKWISHSISKTCNLPNSATKELVSEIYMTAWESGCKGFTVYRDGCRDGVLIEAKEKKESDTTTLSKTNAPKRPKTLNCDVHHIRVKGTDYFVMVGIWPDGTPYEVFAGKNGFINKNIKKGELTKKARGEYCCKFDDGSEACNISKYINEEQEAITRLVSLGLRHGCDINFLVHQLEKTNGSLDSFSKALTRALKKYIKDGVKVTGDVCKNCGSTHLIRQEGCITCLDCNWSKCG